MTDRPQNGHSGDKAQSNRPCCVISSLRKLGEILYIIESPERRQRRLKKEETASAEFLCRNVKYCPHCDSGVLRHGGCFAVYCLCGCVFCYLCGVPTEYGAKTRHTFNHTDDCPYSVAYHRALQRGIREDADTKSTMIAKRARMAQMEARRKAREAEEAKKKAEEAAKKVAKKVEKAVKSEEAKKKLKNPRLLQKFKRGVPT